MDNEEDYEAKAQKIFRLINNYRTSPRQLAKHLEMLKTYLDTSTNVLSEPNKVPIQMVEGESVFDEAIEFLTSLTPMKPFEWCEGLAKSAEEHVKDIGPKGLLIYQSSDGVEPEDRISKYGTYVDSLGENIDFGPNDAMGVIVSLVLDDGEVNRPHRENLFGGNYKKIGISCGPHSTEYQMCVMDLAFDFIPKDNQRKQVNKNDKMNNTMYNEPVVNLYLGENKEDTVNKTEIFSTNPLDLMKRKNSGKNNYVQNNTSPYVKLSLDNEDFRNMEKMNKPNINPSSNEYYSSANNDKINEIDNAEMELRNANEIKKIVSKKVEILTKITYVYEDDSTKVVSSKETHIF